MGCPLAADDARMCAVEAGVVISFPNECTATCQGFKDAAPCLPAARASTSSFESPDPPALEPGQFLPESRRVTSGHVSLDVMNQLAHQGFRFIGQFKFLEADPSPQVERLPESQDPLAGSGDGDAVTVVSEAVSAEDAGEEGSASTAASQDDSVREVHVTFPEGYVYVRTSPREGASVSALAAHMPGDGPLDRRRRTQAAGTRHPHRGAARRLRSVFPPDSRTFRNPAAAGYPAQSILWLRFQNATGSGFTCSGSMISSRAFLTAGHCVFTPGGGAHKNFLLYSGASEPDGRVAATRLALDGENVTVRSVRALTGWTVNGRFSFDVAVLTLNQPVGDKLGWFGIANDDCRSIRQVAPLSNWGYPGDKVRGTQWGMRGCSVQSVDSTANSTCGNAGIFRHDCDTFSGQSGSPIYDDDLYVHGVVSFGQENRFNGAPFLGGVNWDMVLAVVDDTTTTAEGTSTTSGTEGSRGGSGDPGARRPPPPPAPSTYPPASPSRLRRRQLQHS